MSAAVAVTGELIATRKVGAFTHLTFVAPGVGEGARPGHLASFAVGGQASALVARRTLPIHAVTPSGTYGGTLDVVVDGSRDAGMQWLADRRVHDEVELIAPLGRAYPLPEEPLPCLVVGVDEASAPLAWLARALRDRGCTVELVVAGSDDRHLFGVIEARRLVGNVAVVTPGEDGLLAPLESAVRAAVPRHEAAIVYASAPAAELCAISAVAESLNAVTQVAITEDMPCGTGLCAACAVPVRGRDGRVYTIRACSDGPVLRGNRVVWEQYVAAVAGDRP